jgi:type II secretory pathway component GspD/PulD (secretin)
MLLDLKHTLARIVAWRLRRKCARLAIVIALLGVSAPAFADSIPWRPDVRFSRTSVDDDVRSILRSLLRANGLSAIFRPGVEGPISLRFDKVRPGQAFEQLMTERGLAYEYNSDTRTVTVYKDAAVNFDPPERVFIALTHTRYPALREMLVRFGLGLEGVAFDSATSTVSVKGRSDRVKEITALINQVETAASLRIETDQAAIKQQQAARRDQLEANTYAEIANAKVRVIPLRFASVGETTRQFHGRSVTVPGISDTLKAIIGDLNIGGDAGSANARAGESDAAFERRVSQLARPRISIDRRTNSVIVRGSPGDVATIAQVIRELDQPLKMIEIEVIIATASLGVAEELGVALRGSATQRGSANGSAAGDTGSSGGQVGNDAANLFDSDGLNALSLLPAVGASSTIAAFVVRGASSILQVQLKALAEENKAQVLSAPRLVTLDNRTARITRSQDVFVQVDAGGDQGQSLEQIETGLTLEITPSIVPAVALGEGNLIRLNLNAINSAPGAGVFGQIDVRSQEVQTEVLVPNGGTYIIGGLFDDERRERESGVPGLKDVPVLGRLFKENTASSALSETIFFITPRIVEGAGPFGSDIATRLGTPDYVASRRRTLDRASESMLANPDAEVRKSARPFRLLSELEEDES